MKVDKTTRRWIANAADEYAAEAHGCCIDEYRVDHFFNACRDNIVLWEGRSAGKPWEPLGWHYETLAPIFGWVRYDEELGRWVRRFRVASIWIGKKNGKSPTGAVVGLYLLRFDGEQGQQVYTAAKDGKQAMICHNNALNMVKASPRLGERLKVNRTTGRISYLDTMSFYEPMASDNVRAQEGKNGSIIIDECHVVDRAFGRVIADMGASRAEPLRFEISTGGEDEDKYGWDQYQYGKEVEQGRVRDIEFFFKAYEVPQGTDDASLLRMRKGKPAKTTVDLWRMANPALGETITIQAFTQSAIRARASQTTWRAFKARRFNLWQTGLRPWLAAIWPDEDAEIELGDLADSWGSLGMDLARVRDITAAVYCCEHPKEEGRELLYPMFWLNEDRYDELVKADVPQLADWRDRGFIRITAGKVTDFAVIEETVNEFIEDTDCQLLVYDPKFADDITFRIENETAIARVSLRQTLDQYTVPCDNFERAIRTGRMAVCENEVLDWQARHVTLIERAGRKAPMKPESGTYKTIDGIAAAVMAHHGWMSLADFDEETDDQHDIV